MRTRTFRTLLSLGAGLGLIASIFSAAEYYDAQLAQACSINSSVSCGKILTSGLTTTLGVQDWAWGIAGFVAILVLAAAIERRRREPRLAYAALALTTAGVGLAAYLGYVEVAEIHGVCPVCVAAYVFGAVAWVGAIGVALRTYRREHRAPEPAESTA